MAGLNLDNSPNFHLLTLYMVNQLKPGDCFYWRSNFTGWTRCWVFRVSSCSPGRVFFWLDADAETKHLEDMCALSFDQMLNCGVLK